MLWYSDLPDNRRFPVYVYVSIKRTRTKLSVSFYTLWKWYCWANSSNEKRRGGEEKKKKKDKSWEGSINFIASGGLKTTKITNNHRYVNYIRFSNSIYIKFILPFLSTRQYQLSTTYAIRKKGKKKKKQQLSLNREKRRDIEDIYHTRFCSRHFVSNLIVRVHISWII